MLNTIRFALFIPLVFLASSGLAMDSQNESKDDASVSVPKASRCESSLKLKPHFTIAAHSLFAEVFHEGGDPREAALATVRDLVARYAETDADCDREEAPSTLDRISCTKVAGTGGPICEVPSDSGRFIVIKDYVDSATIIYVEDGAEAGILGREEGKATKVRLPAPSACYSDLLNHGGLYEVLAPSPSGDHYSFYMSTRGLKGGQSSVGSGVELVNRVVDSLHRKSPETCARTFDSVVLPAESCFVLGRTSICVLPSPQAGYFVVTKDDAFGAYVSFARYD